MSARRRRPAVRLGLAVIAMTMAACAKPGAYQCLTATDCGVAGACAVADDGRRYCAFPSSTCPGGLAFGDQAGSQAGVCVAGEVDAGPDGMPDALDGPAPVRIAAECVPGLAIAPAVTACPAVCDRLPSCCVASWTRMCVQLAEIECDLTCGSRVAFASTSAVDVYDVTATGVGDAIAVTPLPGFGTAGQFYRSVAWADFERDRTPELVVTTASGNVGGDEMWLLHPGATPPEVTNLRPLHPGYEGFEVVTGDYDHDGRLDVILAGISPGVELFRALDPATRFELGAPVPAPVDGYLGSSVDVGDHDNDGDDDLVALDYTTGTGRVLWWQDDRFVLGPGFVTGEVPRRVAFGDVDGDHDLDLAIAVEGGVRVLRTDITTDGTGTVITLSELWSHSVPGSDFTDAAWIDVDGDRDLDLAVVEAPFNGGPVRIFENDPVPANGGRRFPAVASWTSVTRVAAARLAVGDVDGDGDLDLAVADTDGPNTIYLNDGDAEDLSFSVGWTAPEARGFSYGVALTAR